MTTFLPCFLYIVASFPAEVVLPLPFTPIISNTKGFLSKSKSFPIPSTEFNSFTIFDVKIFFSSKGVFIFLSFASFLRKSIISSAKSKPVSPEINCSSRFSQNSASKLFEENNFDIPPLHFSRTPCSFSFNFANNAMSALPVRSFSHEYKFIA